MNRAMQSKPATRRSFAQIVVLALLASLVYVTAPFSSNSVDSAQAADAQSFCFDGINQGAYLDVSPVNQGDFTFELWVKPDKIKTSQYWAYLNGGLLYQNNLGNFGFITVGSAWDLGVRVTVDQWVHFAVVRENTEIRYYLDGQLVLQRTSDGVSLNRDDGLQLGGVDSFLDGDPSYHSGCMAGVSYSTSPNYTGESFVPKYPGELTPTADTVVLLNASGNSLTNSVAGGPALMNVGSPTIPMDVGSLTYSSVPSGVAQSFCFDGTQAPYLTVPAAGKDSFTIELWIKPTEMVATRNFVSLGNLNDGGQLFYSDGYPNIMWYTGSTFSFIHEPPINQWVHLAIVRDAKTATTGDIHLYVNGQLDRSVTNHTLKDFTATRLGIGNSNIGSNFKGCMAGVSYSTSANYTGAPFTPKYPGELTTTADTVVLLNASDNSLRNWVLGGPALTGAGSLSFESASTLVDGTYSCSGGGSYTLTGTTISAATDCAGAVILPNGVTGIADGAFMGASTLTSIVLPPSLTSINQRSFDGTTGLTSVTFPEGLTKIGRYAFAGSGLTSISLPSTLTSGSAVDVGAFSGNLSLLSATLSEGITSVRDQLFFGATNLTTVTLPSTVTTIGASAFKDTLLGSITLPAGLTSIGTSAFQSTPLGSITLPSGLTNIGESAFQSTSLASITIPATVSTLGKRAFNETKLLESLIFESPSALTKILDNTFQTTSILNSVEIPASVTSIGSNAFAYTGASSITFETGSQLQSIGSFGFYTANNFQSVILPVTLTSMGNNAFGSTDSLKSVFYEGATAPAGFSTAFKNNTQHIKDFIVLPTATGFPSPGSSWVNGTIIKWKVNVAFDAQGGDSVATETSVPVVNSPVTTKSGYTFEGWFDDPTAGDEIVFPYTPSADITVYAHWKVPSKTVTYSAGANGTGADQTDEKVPDVTLALPSTATANNYFTRTGYTVSGWNTNADGSSGTSYALGASFTGNSDITLYPEWTAATFGVIFEYNGATAGNTSASATYTTGSTRITLPTPTKPGYTFNSWHTNPALDALSIVGVGGASYSPTTNLTIYAKWTAIARTVTYGTTNSTSGTAPSDATSYIIDQTVVVKANSGSLVRSGYSFDGWQVGGVGAVYNAGESVVVAEANIVFEPVWSAITYTYSYNLNGGSGDLSGAPTTWETGTASITLPGTATGFAFTKTGYTFGGWSTTQGGSAEAYSFNNVGNLTLYAVWNIKPISYTFGQGVASGATFTSWPADSSANYGTSLTLPTPSPTTVTVNTKTYQFAGWTESTLAYEAGQGFILGDASPAFVAQWIELLDVTYVYSGGSPTDGEGDGDAACVTSGLCTDPQTINLRAAPVRTGYTFAGWKVVDTDTSAEQTIAAGQAATVTDSAYIFNAQWTAIQYSMTFNSLGGSLNPDPQAKTIGQLVTMPSPGTKTGYTFTGWTPDSGSTSYAVGSTVTTGTQAISFSAQWTPNVYTVTYEWRGGVASGSPKTSDSFTFSASGTSLPTAASSSYARDGFDFAGWSTSPDGSTSNFPIGDSYYTASDVVLYAIWDAGNFTLTYDGKGASAGSGSGAVANGSSITLPTPVRANFTFLGWYDQATGGILLGDGGDSYAPTSTRTLFARWVQDSLYGVDEAQLQDAVTFTVNSNQDGTGGGLPVNDSASGSTATIDIPNLSLPAGTLVKARYFKETDRQAGILDAELGQSNDYLFSLLVSWSLGTGDAATVPTTATGKPITVTLNNSAIKAGASVYQLIGTSVTDLGVAEVDGTIVVELTTDPEIVVLATKPAAPTNVTGVAGDGQWVVSWTPGASGGATITSYTATATPGGASCTTSNTTCTVTGLTNGVSYTFTVTATNSVGTSDTSGASAITSFTVTFNSNGGSSVAAGSFSIGGAVSAPTEPTQSGFDFSGWSTDLDDDTTAVTFPYSPGVNAGVTLYALWTVSSSSSSGYIYETPTAPSLKPTAPVTPITTPEGTVAGSSEQVSIAADSPNEKLVATGSGWELKISTKNSTGQAQLVTQELKLEFQLASRAELAGTGLQPNAKVSVWVFSEPTYVGEVSTNSQGAFDDSLLLPASILPGDHTLQVLSTDPLGRVITLNIPITVKGKVTVGSFKGFLALYTKDLVGQKLSAKIAGRWLVQDPIANYKSYGYSRFVRKTGAGYKIYAHLYLNGVFLRTDVITTK